MIAIFIFRGFNIKVLVYKIKECENASSNSNQSVSQSINQSINALSYRKNQNRSLNYNLRGIENDSFVYSTSTAAKRISPSFGQMKSDKIVNILDFIKDRMFYSYGKDVTDKILKYLKIFKITEGYYNPINYSGVSSLLDEEKLLFRKTPWGPSYFRNKLMPNWFFPKKANGFFINQHGNGDIYKDGINVFSASPVDNTYFWINNPKDRLAKVFSDHSFMKGKHLRIYDEGICPPIKYFVYQDSAGKLIYADGNLGPFKIKNMMFYKNEIDGKTYNFTVDSKGEKHFLYFADNYYNMSNDICHLAAYEDNGILKLLQGSSVISIKQLNDFDPKVIAQKLNDKYIVPHIKPEELKDFIQKYNTQKQEFLAIKDKLKVPTQDEIKKQVEKECDLNILKSLFDEI